MKIAASVLDDIVAHAREAAPDECCGLLLGRADELVRAFRTRNIAESPSTRFLIDPADHFGGRREARNRGLEVIGFYHSHPSTPAAPSPADVAEASYSGSLYLIVSLAADPPEVKLFRFHDGSFQSVRLMR